MPVWSLSGENPLEEEMATHSSIPAWRTPWIAESGGLQSMGSKRVGHDWAQTCRMYTRSWGWDPYEWDLCPYERDPRGLPCLSAIWRHKKNMLSRNKEAGSHQTPNLPVPWSWMFQTPKLWELNVCCWRHLDYGVLVIAAWVMTFLIFSVLLKDSEMVLFPRFCFVSQHSIVTDCVSLSEYRASDPRSDVVSEIIATRKESSVAWLWAPGPSWLPEAAFLILGLYVETDFHFLWSRNFFFLNVEWTTNCIIIISDLPEQEKYIT